MQRFQPMIQTVLSMIAITIIAPFVLLAGMSLSPIDPLHVIIGNDMRTISPEQRDLIAERWQLNAPIWMRGYGWWSMALQGDVGESLIYRKPVFDVIIPRLVASLRVVGIAWLISGVLGFFLGVFMALRQTRLDAEILRGMIFLMTSTPSFLVSMIAIAIFAVQLQWFPACCALPIGVSTATTSELIWHAILPISVLTVLGIPMTALHTRQSVKTIMDTDMWIFLVANGCPLPQRLGILVRLASVPALTLQGATISELVGGSVVVETVFVYPGIGDALAQAALKQDIPLLMVSLLLTIVIVFCGNLIADMIIVLSNPVRRESNEVQQ